MDHTHRRLSVFDPRLRVVVPELLASVARHLASIMIVTFKASRRITDTQPEMVPTFTLQDASLRADLIEGTHYHQRALERSPSSEIQRSFLAEVTHLLRGVEASGGQAAEFQDSSSYLTRRYSSRIAEGDFLKVRCGACSAMLTASEVAYDSWTDDHAAGRTLFCRCGERLWLHFDVTPK